MLKLETLGIKEGIHKQPPSGGCVLKHDGVGGLWILGGQPPSGGCVLKRLQALELVFTWVSRLRAAVC